MICLKRSEANRRNCNGECKRAENRMPTKHTTLTNEQWTKIST